MGPLQLALKMIFQPNMALVHIVDYIKCTESKREMYKFRQDVVERIRNIQKIVTPNEPSFQDKHPNTKHNQTVLKHTINEIESVKELIFSCEKLTSILRYTDPIQIDNVVIALLVPGQVCRVPLGFSKLTHIEVAYGRGILNLSFETAFGRFHKNGRKSETIRGNKLEIPFRFRGNYVGEITLKDHGKNIQFSAVSKRSIKTVSSRPIISLYKCSILYIILRRSDRENHQILREILLLEDVNHSGDFGNV